MTQEALRMALEWAEAHGEIVFAGGGMNAVNKMNSWVAAIKEALAQPEQEPVALPCCGYTDSSAIKWNPYSQVVQCHNCGQVYTTPPQRTWVGLTDEDCKSMSAGDKVVAMWADRTLKEKNSA
jgi:hypothetical protein